MGYICTCACRPHFFISGSAWPIVFKFGMVDWRSPSTCFPQAMCGWGISARAHLCMCARAPPPPYLRIGLTNFAKIWCVTRDLIVTRFTKIRGGVAAHSHVRLHEFRYLENRSALTLKPHQKQTYLFRVRSFIAKHGVLLVVILGGDSKNDLFGAVFQNWLIWVVNDTHLWTIFPSHFWFSMWISHSADDLALVTVITPPPKP